MATISFEGPSDSNGRQRWRSDGARSVPTTRPNMMGVDDDGATDHRVGSRPWNLRKRDGWRQVSTHNCYALRFSYRLYLPYKFERDSS